LLEHAYNTKWPFFAENVDQELKLAWRFATSLITDKICASGHEGEASDILGEC